MALSVYHCILSVSCSVYLYINCSVTLSIALFITLSICCLFVVLSVSLCVGLYIGRSVFIILSNVCQVLFLIEYFSLPPCLHTYTHTLVFMCVSICACVYGGAALSLCPQPKHPRVPRLHGLGRRRALLIFLFLTHPPSQVPLHLCPSLPRRPALTPAQASPHAAKERTQQEASHVSY